MKTISKLRRQVCYRPLGGPTERQAGLATPGTLSLEEIPKELLIGLLVSEDPRFFQHHGFDTWAMGLAIKNYWRGNRPLTGASTLVQKLAKNLFLTDVRTLGRKVWELFFAVQLEREFTKEELLVLFLNNMEWGLGIYGLRAAAQFHFGKSPRDLTIPECAFLIVILPNPRALSPEGGMENLVPQARARFQKITSQIALARREKSLCDSFTGNVSDFLSRLKNFDLRDIFFVPKNASHPKASLNNRYRSSVIPQTVY